MRGILSATAEAKWQECHHYLSREQNENRPVALIMQQRDTLQRKHMGTAELGRITSCVDGYQIVYSLHLHYHGEAEGVGDVRLPEIFLLFSVPCFFMQRSSWRFREGDVQIVKKICTHIGSIISQFSLFDGCFWGCGAEE